ncbi:TonB-dependent receptor [Seonamhaeicola sp. MEBiC1930]|uniref:SusC/RagA family TonB-linked outer membrane protein n=1 Tax=Seonamhaeicola sp. MEBiC01930 TaxID=2976768 RepID=UPI003244C451
MLFYLIPLLFFGQSITGTVTDESNQPLPGASVLVKGTSNGVTTDFDGKYSITVSSKEAVLIVSYIGFASQEIKINNQNEINIVLVEDAFGLDEVVMVGYSRVKKSDLTGAVSSVKPKDLNLGNVSNAGQMLQGRVTGLYVNSYDQDPGATPEFILRGASSLQGGEAGQPLVVIDGFPVEGTAALNTINPNDIAQIDVLKDASATAIYGSRGANGVILITTKTGNTSGVQIDYGVKLSTQVVARTIDMMNADQYARFYLDLAHDPNLQIGSFGPGDAPHSLDEIGNLPNTDWQEELINDSNFNQEHNLAVSGVNGGVKYHVSASYLLGDGVIGPSSYERLITSAKLSFEKKRFSFNSNFNFTNENRNNVRNSYEDALRFSPSSPVYDESGEFSQHASDNMSWVTHPLFDETAIKNFSETNTIRINAGLTYEFFDGLRLELTGGLEQKSPENFTERSKATFNSQEPTAGSLSKGSEKTIFADYFLKYNKNFDKHTLALMGGGSYYSYRGRTLSASSENFPYVGISYFNVNAGLDNRTLNSDWIEKKTISGLLRINYDYDKKFFLTSSYRIDGASQFGENEKWGLFPSISMAYRLDQEDFFKEKFDFLKTFKIRAGYGSAGNANIPSFRTQNLIDFTPAYTGVIANGLQNVGLYKPNPDLKWEETSTLNIGLEFGNNNFYTEINVYNKKSEDLLLDRQLPTETGFSSITLNKGVMENKGVEAKLNLYLDFFNGKLKWNPGVWLSVNKNKILDLDGDKIAWNPTWIASTNYGLTGIRQEGYPLNAQWGYDFTGIWQESEATEAAAYGASPGDPKFADINNDNLINQDDLQYLGSANPEYTAGFNNRFNYNNFELSFFIEGVFDKLVVNTNKVALTYPALAFGRNLLASSLDRWTPNNPSNDVPSLTKAPTEALVRSDWAMEDASFIRLRDITLAYTFDFKKDSAFKNLRMYLSGTNIFTITDYSGVNPDASILDASWNLRPYSRTFTFGLNASF